MPQKIMKRGANSWRLTPSVRTPDGRPVKPKTIRLDPALSEDLQLLQAKRELAIWEASLAAGRNATSHTVRSWSEEWLDKHLLDASPVTVANYRHLLGSRILPHLGDVLLADLTPTLLTDWLITVRNAPRKSTRLPDDKLSHPRSPSQKLATAAQRKRPLSVNTVNHYYTCMTAMLNAAVRLGYLEHNPMERVQRPHQRKQPLVILTEEGAAALISAVADQPAPYRLSVLLALLCGLRLGEIVALTWYDIDFHNCILHITHAVKYVSGSGGILGDPKTDASTRDVTVPQSLSVELARAMAADIERLEFDRALAIEQAEEAGLPQEEIDKLPQPVSATWVVCDRNGAQLHKDTPSKWFRRFADTHGFPGLRFHDLRHAHASILVAHNLDVAAIAARLGHSDPSLTLHTYTHAFRAGDVAAATTMDALFTSAASRR